MNKSRLSSHRQRALKLMQEIGFGRIEALMVRSGEPVFDPPPRVIREIKFGGENGPRPELSSPDFALKAQVLELLEQFDRLGNAVIDVLVVKHGLPFAMQVAVDGTLG